VKKLFSALLILACFLSSVTAQEYFTISSYDVAVTVNKDASLNVDETINVHFTEPRHGIYRFIPYRYELEPLPAATEKANRQLESGGYAHTIIDNISVDGWNYDVTADGNYKSIKIGSADRQVDGDQQYVIHYRIQNAINFFKDHSELYFNIIGNKWNTTIDSVTYTVSFYDAVPDTTSYFVATGPIGSTENETVSNWSSSSLFAGHTISKLNSNEGVTIGISLPKDFLIQQDYNIVGIYWLFLPAFVFAGMLLIWRRWGKDQKPTIQTEFYPPANISPSISGYIIDDTLNRRDLTALVPYWGAGGYLKIKETEKSSMLGLIKDKEYTFIKVKDLPQTAMDFEQTLFNGIFATGDTVKLSDLANVLYTTMNKAKAELESEIKKDQYYVKGSQGLVVLFVFLGVALTVYGAVVIFGILEGYTWFGISILTSGIISFVFGIFMRKKTTKGTELYQKLLGFKEFVKSVEKDRLAEFLKQDEQYFDKVLPYAIVFGIADTWKDKLRGLDIPPPKWYNGNYTTFNAWIFMNSLNHSMNAMSSTFYSTPNSSGSSGGSFSGGGFSGGGFGGGGGSSW
jgi:uncharacterized membrane protein